ncbi:MAG: hypothetical protein M3442_08200 [Chloroflexota bacterium]|nr:hypothetical protein [Chloroflexota bacterium]
MTTRADYTAEEWRTLSQLPVAVSLAVITSGKSNPMQRVRELTSMVQTLEDTRRQQPANELVTAVAVADGERPGDGARAAGALPSPDLSEGGAELQRQAVAQCLQAAAILAAKSTPAEAEGYKRWVVAIGRKVAEAAKEGGFLGIGGGPVSPEETETLNAVTAALELSP